jgi:hypothetical protein
MHSGSIDYHAIAETIAKHERQILYVGRSLKEPSFAYTIGNQEKDLPELLMLGNFHPEACCAVLNALSDLMIKQGRCFTDGEETLELGGKVPIRIIDARDPIVKRSYTMQAGQFYKNEDYDVQQVIVPDENGRWPDDPQCHASCRVPVLMGPRLLLS